MMDKYLFAFNTTRSLFDPSTEPLDTFSCSLLAVVHALEVAGKDAPLSLLLLPEYPDLRNRMLQVVYSLFLLRVN